MSIATLTSKGQITLPKKIRQMLHLEAGEKVDFQIDEKAGTATMIPLNKHVDDVFGLLHRKKQGRTIGTGDMDKHIRAGFRRKYR